MTTTTVSRMTATRYAFFYGTLLRLDILKRALGDDGGRLRVAPALLLEYTRVRIRERGYPTVLPSANAQDVLFKRPLTAEERSVQGIVVSGLTHQDIAFLDNFEGGESAREILKVIPLEPEVPLASLTALPGPRGLTRDSVPSIEASVYVWAGEQSQLQASSSSYEDLLRDISRLRSQFGHPMKREFNMDDSYLNLNHGSYGTVPLRVIEYAEKLGRQCDARPDLWWRRTADPLILEARQSVATLLDVDVDECVLVPNATSGLNHVIRNIHWKAGDVIVANSTTYDSVSLMMQYQQDLEPGLELSYLQWSFPMSHNEIVARFRSHLQIIKRHEGQKIMVIIDAIPSSPGVLLPWERMVQVCKEENVWSLIDAAHAIGQIRLDLKAVDPDFWVSNCHKWLYARRGCAVFYVPKRNQHLITTAFPTSFAYKRPKDIPQPYEPGAGASNNFVANFAPVLMNATMDFVPFISVTEAIRFRQDIGGEKAIRLYCHLLALRGGRRMAEIFGTRVMDPDGSLTANMVNVQLPLVVRSQQTKADLGSRRSFIKERMLTDYDCAVQPYTHNGSWWFRASAQIFNEVSDFEFAAQHIKKMCDAFTAEDEEKWGKP